MMHFGQVLWSGSSGLSFALLATLLPWYSFPAMVAYAVVGVLVGLGFTLFVGKMFLPRRDEQYPGARFDTLGVDPDE